MSPELLRYAVNRIKMLATLAVPNYELPADSFIEQAIVEIFNKAHLEYLNGMCPVCANERYSDE